MIRFDVANQKHCRQRKKTEMWSDHYFPSKILCFLVVPNDKSTYALVYSTMHNSHKNDSILFKRWELDHQTKVLPNGKRSILPNLHIVDVDSFGDPILVVEDYMIKELSENNEKATVTVVIPFVKEWPNKFMSCYCT